MAYKCAALNADLNPSVVAVKLIALLFEKDERLKMEVLPIHLDHHITMPSNFALEKLQKLIIGYGNPSRFLATKKHRTSLISRRQRNDVRGNRSPLTS